jgi:hypothetical protein
MDNLGELQRNCYKYTETYYTLCVDNGIRTKAEGEEIEDIIFDVATYLFHFVLLDMITTKIVGEK